jgi:hypothetical protein
LYQRIFDIISTTSSISTMLKKNGLGSSCRRLGQTPVSLLAPLLEFNQAL